MKRNTMPTLVSVFQDGQPTTVDLEEMIATAVKAALPRGKNATAREKTMTDLGQGVQYYVEENRLVLSVDLSPEAWEKARPTKGKQNLLLASSRGTPYILESPIPKVRLALNVYTEEEPPGKPSS